MIQWPDEVKLRVLALTDATNDATKRNAVLERFGVPRTTWLHWVDLRKRGLLDSKPGRPSEIDKRIERKLEPLEERVARLEKKEG